MAVDANHLKMMLWESLILWAVASFLLGPVRRAFPLANLGFGLRMFEMWRLAFSTACSFWDVIQ
jgi:hypothetical protein